MNDRPEQRCKNSIALKTKQGYHKHVQIIHLLNDVTTAMTNSLKDMNPPSAEGVRNLLRRIIDPEVGVNVVDLGLIYDIDAGDGTIRIDMTMTSPACPMGEMIQDEIRSVLTAEFGSQCVIEITLVWLPVWTPEMMSKEAKQALGWEL